MSEKNQRRKVVEGGTLLVANDKYNVTANKIITYFQWLSFQN